MKKLNFETSKGKFVVVDQHEEVPFGYDPLENVNVLYIGYIYELTEQKAYIKPTTFRYYRCVNHKPKI